MADAMIGRRGLLTGAVLILTEGVEAQAWPAGRSS
jgi:hypothetical protein